MKKWLKRSIITIIILVIIAVGAIVTINLLHDESKLTVDEKKWINSNLSTVQNVNVLNNVDIFGNNGYGVFFDFIQDFSKEYQLKINPITYNLNEINVNDGFKMTNVLDEKSVVLYEDYYVMISKSDLIIRNNSDLSDKKIGILKNDSDYIKSYLNNVNFTLYDSYSDLEKAFNESSDINYMVVPRSLYIGSIVKNNYKIVYYLGDIKNYYVYEMKDNDVFSNIIKKYFNSWKKDNLNRYIDSNLLNTLMYNLNLTEIDLANIKSKVYRYGLINNSPYEVLIGGNYGGIVSQYLKRFSDLSGVEFKYIRYKNYNNFVNALNKGEVDIYFNYYNDINDFKTVNTNIYNSYVVIAKNNNNLVVNSLNSLKNKDVYVLENSILFNQLSSVTNINVKTYKSIDELKKLSKKDIIIMLDEATYNYMNNNELKNYTIRYSNTIDKTYNFKLNADDSFIKLFNGYITSQNPEYLKISGLEDYSSTIKKGSFFGQMAKYILIILVAIILLIYIFYKSTKKIKISKKIRKEDKIKFIDQLTSLKNRNYLNENISVWNKNSIYPQATVIIDLNKIQEINDTFGYDEGDKQIKAASNILIRTQLDNSDIMRTDGNEFLIYLVGYERRSVESYIRKLVREFKKLPYDYSAIISYSMIEDDIKTIEDAINEAVDDMKEKKQEI